MSDGARSYQFVVVAVATVDNVEVLGERPTIAFTFPSSSDGGVKYILCATTFIWAGRDSHHEYETFMYIEALLMSGVILLK